MRQKLNYFFISLRPFQWYKNLLVFFPLIFSGNLFDLKSLFLSLIVFLCFSLSAGWVYVFNDICDISKDRAHPIKKNRPIAAQKITPRFSLTAATIILFVGFGLSGLVSYGLTIVLLLYILLNVFYSLIFKHVFIIDISLIAFGFLLRLFAGVITIDSNTSYWLLLCIFSLAIFLVAGKRSNELTFLNSNGMKHQINFWKYNLKNLDILIIVSFALTIISYILFSMDSSIMSNYGIENLVISLPFVIYGMLRYLHLIRTREHIHFSKINIFKDRPIIFNNLLFVSIILWNVYL